MKEEWRENVSSCDGVLVENFPMLKENLKDPYDSVLIWRGFHPKELQSVFASHRLDIWCDHPLIERRTVRAIHITEFTTISRNFLSRIIKFHGKTHVSFYEHPTGRFAKFDAFDVFYISRGKFLVNTDFQGREKLCLQIRRHSIFF